MLETKIVLAYIFLNYWATEKQREIINAKFIKDIEVAEMQKRELYDIDVLKNKKQLEETKKEDLEMVVYKKENFIVKIFNKILRLFGIEFKI